MDEIKLPKLYVTNDHKIWLSYCWDYLIETGSLAGYKQVRLRTSELLPKKYTPWKIHEFLLRDKIEVTTLAIISVEKQAELLKIADKVFLYIKDSLIQDPDDCNFELNEIAKNIQEDSKLVRIIYSRVANDVDGLYNSAGSKSGREVFGYDDISIGENSFDTYFNYDSIYEVIKDYYERIITDEFLLDQILLYLFENRSIRPDHGGVTQAFGLGVSRATALYKQVCRLGVQLGLMRIQTFDSGRIAITAINEYETQKFIASRISLRQYLDDAIFVPEPPNENSQNGNKTSMNFVSSTRIEELKEITSTEFDLTRLIRLCEELNLASNNEMYLSLSVLTRALIDHIPPIFGKQRFTEVANSFGSKSFKENMSHLQNFSRKIADGHLHTHIGRKEVLPTDVQVNFSPAIDVLLAEIVKELS